MTCETTRLELSNRATTSVVVTPTSDPGDGTPITFESAGLGIDLSEDTADGSVTFDVSAVSAGVNALFDATLQVDTNPAVAVTIQVVDSNDAQTVGVSLDDTDVTYCAATGGQSASSLNGPVLFAARNNAGSTLAKGELVYISGHSGNKPDVGRAIASDSSKMPAFGFTYESAAQGEDIRIVTLGDLPNVNTAANSVGDLLYVDATAAGSKTSTPPTGEANAIQNVGIVVRSDATAGRIKVFGAGRANDTPNLNNNKLFVGDSSNEAQPKAMSAINLSEFNNDLSGLTGGNDYLSKPTYTNNQVRLFDDFYNCTPDRIDAGVNQWWLNSGGSGVTPQDYVATNVRGATRCEFGNTNNRRFTFWGPMFLTGADAANNDKIMWEARVQVTDNTATAGALRLGLVNWDSTLNFNDSSPYGTGYSVVDYACIAIDLASTNLQISYKGTGSAGNGTNVDLGSSYPRSSYVDTFVRLGVYAAYNTTDSDWDCTFYINGTSVHTQSVAMNNALVPYLGDGHGTTGGAHSMEVDWISCQVKQGSPPSGRTTLVDIDSAGG